MLTGLGLCCCARAFSSCSDWGLLSSCHVRASHCGGFSCCRAQAVDEWVSVVVVHGLNCPVACEIFSDQGLNPHPSSLELAGGFLTTGPPGKPFSTYIYTCMLLLSHFSRVRLLATPQMAAHQAPLSLGFSRQEHWSGLPFPSPMHESEK